MSAGAFETLAKIVIATDEEEQKAEQRNYDKQKEQAREEFILQAQRQEAFERAQQSLLPGSSLVADIEKRMERAFQMGGTSLLGNKLTSDDVSNLLPGQERAQTPSLLQQQAASNQNYNTYLSNATMSSLSSLSNMLGGLTTGRSGKTPELKPEPPVEEDYSPKRRKINLDRE